MKMPISKKQLLKQLANLGDITLVKPHNIRLRLNDNAEVALKTHFDAVLYFMQGMDTKMLNLILDNKYTYQDLSKKVFLERLDLIFDIFKDDGSNYLNVFDGKCKECYCDNPNVQGFTFEGNNECNFRMNLLFESENNEVIDISECVNFENDLKEIEAENYISISDFDYLEYNLDSYGDNDDMPF